MRCNRVSSSAEDCGLNSHLAGDRGPVQPGHVAMAQLHVSEGRVPLAAREAGLLERQEAPMKPGISVNTLQVHTH